MAVPPAQPPAPRRPPSAKKPQTNPPVMDEKTASARIFRIQKIVVIEAWTIGGLILLLIVALNSAQPFYLYYAMSPDKNQVQMFGYPMPNMTKRAILAWATTGVTEVMTMGFGDMDIKLPKMRKYFTKGGWKAYVKAFEAQKVSEGFKQNQLVLTTVPSNAPVIVAQGVNANNVYEWVVQMPIIMTYATNNNKTYKKNGVITLTIVRVPAEESADGIAIEDWLLH